MSPNFNREFGAGASLITAYLDMPRYSLMILFLFDLQVPFVALVTINLQLINTENKVKKVTKQDDRSSI